MVWISETTKHSAALKTDCGNGLCFRLEVTHYDIFLSWPPHGNQTLPGRKDLTLPFKV